MCFSAAVSKINDELSNSNPLMFKTSAVSWEGIWGFGGCYDTISKCLVVL